MSFEKWRRILPLVIGKTNAYFEEITHRIDHRLSSNSVIVLRLGSDGRKKKKEGKEIPMEIRINDLLWNKLHIN